MGANMTVVEMKTPRAKNFRREVKLGLPVVDDFSAVEFTRPGIHGSSATSAAAAATKTASW